MRTTKVQIHLGISAVWSAPLLNNTFNFLKENFQIVASFYTWAGWFWSHMVINLKTGFLGAWLIWAVSWENQIFVYAKTKTQISCTVTAQLICAFVFATWMVQSLYFLNPKFQAVSHLLWLYSPVCVGPGWKPGRPFISQLGSYDTSPPFEILYFTPKSASGPPGLWLAVRMIPPLASYFLMTQDTAGVDIRPSWATYNLDICNLQWQFHYKQWYELRCEKTGLGGFRPGPTQTGLYSHRRWLEAWHFGFR